MAKTTKPKGATSYKETAFGIIPRSELIKLELKGVKKGLEYIYDLISSSKNFKITNELICKLHQVSFSLCKLRYTHARYGIR